MIAFLIGKDTLFKLILPEIVTGSYWVCDNEDKKLLNIESKAGMWRIVSGGEAQVVDSEKYQKYQGVDNQIEKSIVMDAYLDKYSKHYIHVNDYEGLFVLYCLPRFENYIKLDLKDDEDITIGSDSRQ